MQMTRSHCWHKPVCLLKSHSLSSPATLLMHPQACDSYVPWGNRWLTGWLAPPPPTAHTPSFPLVLLQTGQDLTGTGQDPHNHPLLRPSWAHSWLSHLSLVVKPVSLLLSEQHSVTAFVLSLAMLWVAMDEWALVAFVILKPLESCFQVVNRTYDASGKIVERN